jgi:bacterioferritin (cytochrome b1)
MENEQEHVDDLRKRIGELDGTTSSLGFSFQMAGKVLAFTSTLLGKKFVLKADIRLEKRAVKDYSAFLEKVNFDEESKALIEKNIEDERLHIERWQDSLEMLKG